MQQIKSESSSAIGNDHQMLPILPVKRQKPCRGQQKNKLPHKADDHRMNAFAQSLKNRPKNYAECGERKMNRDNAQRNYTD